MCHSTGIFLPHCRTFLRICCFFFSSIFSESRETGNGVGERGKKCDKCRQGQDLNPGRPRRGLRPPYMDRAYISYDLKIVWRRGLFMMRHQKVEESRLLEAADLSL
ncbi:hypothetical protein AMECASPLE_022039 [Ameca splendens]|uniref:Uncharacterized protein n=1 Tax=Ameca splendens TaxID=208324 RepID=A0ABV1AA23_9TELE